ncbi:beta-propeller domain-containing protein [Ornithinibacillus californiensis]|uniref:beta-propeller domain-containing protein n=1 Tax=Ornithinibacillus californiensis TaxID=161536 RepID=UPI00069EFFEB|nr:beta-propeller domain-containing protein [Ornithinibacillus californiensis]
MYKKIGLISVLVIIGVWMIVIFGFSNKITAEIPSASSFVPTFKDWTIHFSEPMDPNTFTEDTVIVKNEKGERIGVEMEWNNSYNVLTLRAPKEGYTIEEEYEITIKNVVKTATGDTLSKKFKHEFTAVADLPNIKDKKQLVTLLKERIKEEQNGVTLFDAQEESAESETSMDTAASDDSAGGTDGTSSTNVQVQGIDEADIIKTDGKSIFFVRDNDILITSTEKANSKLLSQIKVKNYFPQEIYVYNEQLIVIGQKNETLRNVENETTNKEIGIPEPIYYGQTTILIYDIKNPSEPKQIREVSQEGHYSSSRILDGYLYLIANQHPPYHILSMEEDAEIRPFIKDTAVSDDSMPVDFDDMYYFPESQEEQFLILTSVDLNDMEKEAHMETYLGASNQIYMSHNNLYVAVNKYKEIESQSSDTAENSSSDEVMDIMIWRPQDVDTEITQFRIQEGTLKYNASTLVNGKLINQFAMDERNNTFRVATTKGDTWDEETLSTNNLYTFDMNLQPLGSVEGLAEGERIYSVRFMDEVAYMVTFKQVDPLFVIDLKDPKKPTVLGELKIPGFSNYLHPLDDNHVIGFGQDTKLIKEDGMSEPMVRTDGIKISVFDVSEPTNPTEKFSEVIGQGGSYSELLHNHKVLFKHPTENLFGFPAVLSETKMVNKDGITYEEYNVIFEGALLYEITPDGIRLVDTITHQGEFKEYPEWTSEIRRLVSVDNAIYTLSWDKMKVYDLNQKQVLKTVELPELKFEY